MPRFTKRFVMTVNVGIAVIGLACLFSVAIILLRRPIAAAGPIVLTGAVAYRMRQHPNPERLLTAGILAAIGGGILGQSLDYVLGGIPEDAPSALWLLLGAIGLGGGYGIFVGSLVLVGVMTLPVYKLIFRR